MSRFDLSKFKSPPDEELMCGICRNVLDDPKESPCRHVFCKTCIQRALQEKSKCPICRSALRERHLKDVLPLVQNMLNKLPMECEYCENGCSQPIPMERFLDHVKDCEYMMVTCKNESCDQQILKRDCECHETEDCKYRTYVCDKGCQCLVIFAEKEEHNCLATLLKEKKDLTEKTKELEKKVEELQSIVKSYETNKAENKVNLNDEDSRGRESIYSRSYSFNSIDYNDLDSLSEPFSITPSTGISLSGMSNLSDCSDDYRDDDDLWGSDLERNSYDDGNNEEVVEEFIPMSENGPTANGAMDLSDRFFPLSNILISTRHENGDQPAQSFPISSLQITGASSAVNYQDIPSSSSGVTGPSGSSRKRTVQSGASISTAAKRARTAGSATETGNTAVRRSARLRQIPPSPIANIECVPVPPPSSYLLDIYANENNSSSDDSWSPLHDQRF